MMDSLVQAVYSQQIQGDITENKGSRVLRSGDSKHYML
jgi:hypothetical protein